MFKYTMFNSKQGDQTMLLIEYEIISIFSRVVVGLMC